MPDLTGKKIGIITCSGEEIPEGTVTRLAALKVLESLRPHATVTICLPLFLAGGEGDRAFARFHPTIAVDGCEKRCAARGTERYSGKPAVSIVVDGGAPHESSRLGSARRLGEAGMAIVNDIASQIANHVDMLLGPAKDERHTSKDESTAKAETPGRQATCSCGSGIPVTTLRVADREVAFVGLPLIFAEFCEAGKLADASTKAELMAAVRIYNPIADDDAEPLADLIFQEYRAYCQRGH